MRTALLILAVCAAPVLGEFTIKPGFVVTQAVSPRTEACPCGPDCPCNPCKCKGKFRYRTVTEKQCDDKGCRFVKVVKREPIKSFLGKVTAVQDGDTITVLDGKTQHKIRLAGIDAPERGQAFGSQAKDALAGKVFGKTVRVEWTSQDRYGRTIGEVYLGDRRICLEMLQEGWAWHYTTYSNDKAFSAAELAAWKAGKGLWADRAVAPWEFRRVKKKKTSAIPSVRCVGKA